MFHFKALLGERGVRLPSLAKKAALQVGRGRPSGLHFHFGFNVPSCVTVCLCD